MKHELLEALVGDEAQWTPLQLASAVGNAELVVELLATSPVSSNVKTKYSPLHLAVRFGHVQVVRLLLAASDVNIGDEQARPAALLTVEATALHLAVLQGNAELIRVLLDDGNAAQTPTKNGTTPLQLARQLGRSDLAQLLVDGAARRLSRDQLSDWLAGVGLVQYAPALLAAGFDDPRFLLAAGLPEAALDEMAIAKPGHRAKLQALYGLREFVAELEGQEESEGEEEEEEEEEGSEEESEEEESESESSEGSYSDEGT